MSSKKSSGSTREQILTKSRELFRHQNFSDVSINDIVTALGITKPTLYYYFGSKENLFAETVLEILRRTHQYIISNIKPGSSLERNLTGLAQGYFQYTRMSLSRLMCEAANHLSPANSKRVQEAHQYLVLSPIKDLFVRAIREGEIADYDPMKLAAIFITMLDVFNFRMSVLEDMEPAAKTKLLIHVFFYGIYTR